MKCLITLVAVSGIALAGIISAAPKSLASTYYIDANSGSDSNSGSSSSPLLTLQEAVYKVNNDYASGHTPSGGDTIDMNGNGEVYQLAWYGGGGVAQGNPVTVNTTATSAAPIIIQTTPGQSNAVLVGGNWLGTGDSIDLNGNYITVQYLTMENASGVNIDIPNGSYDTVQYCISTGAQWAGIMIGSTASTHVLQHDAVLNCTVHDNNQTNLNGHGANWAGSLVLSNCEYCNTQYNYVWSNFIYADLNAILRPLYGGVSFPAIGIASDNESNTAPLNYGSQIFNNIVVGGQSCFRAANQNTVTGFYAGGLNGYQVYNNVFYNTSPYNTTSVNPACIQVDNDPNNNFTWENNIVWETNGIVDVASDAGGGTQVITTNCLDGTGGFNMNGPSDVLLWNSSVGFASAGSFSPSGYVLSASSPCY